jgi:GT2 family glycosyltransferase
MIESGFPELSGRAVREARAALARLEDENRAARAELDLVLSSRGRRLLAFASHPIWAGRAACAYIASLPPLVAARGLWRQFRFHRVSLSALAPMETDRRAEISGQTNWIPELRIAGSTREALVVSGDSTIVFRAFAGPHARLQVRCAVMPSLWDVSPGGLEARVRARSASDPPRWERTTSRLIDPQARWRDRGWRLLEVAAPPGDGGELILTLETRWVGGNAARKRASWGDAVLEWPRAIGDRKRLLAAALRRVKRSGVASTVDYARRRQRVDDQAEAYARWIAARRLDEPARERITAAVSALARPPLISVITPVHDTAPDKLTACVESVRRQIYDRWQLCLADDASTSEATRETLRKYTDDPRVRTVRLDRQGGIAAASNAALGLATGEFVALLDHDDELAPEALAEIARYIDKHPDADVIYSDEDNLDAAGARCDPYFKPAWSPDLFLRYMYTCHLTVVRRRLVDDIGGFRAGVDGAQDYDLMLRLMERTDRIHHIPQVLYHWRMEPGSTATGGASKPWAIDAGRRALQDYASRSGLESEVLPGPAPGMYRLRRSIRGEPLVSIVVPTTGQPRANGDDLLARCLRSLSKTTWRNVEVVMSVDRGDLPAGAREALGDLRHRIVSYQPRASFNFSHKINETVRHASGEHLVLFNDDLEVIAPDWLTAMLEYSQESAVGAVGAKLFYPDGRLQHAGMLIGVCGLAAHAFHKHPGQSPGYFGSCETPRNCSAVTAACLMTRRTVFEEVGGFDEALPVDYNDVDFCLRVRRAGYRIVYTPYAQLYHHESASFGRRLQSTREEAVMRERWGTALDDDPYYNANLSKHFSDYRLQL